MLAGLEPAMEEGKQATSLLQIEEEKSLELNFSNVVLTEEQEGRKDKSVSACFARQKPQGESISSEKRRNKSNWRA